ncbi:asparaginase [Streptomyces sp. NPDC005438]|uniref:asparaginase n=1 Tax=Streptomyces sp. NPDC005438 TaxID=3156880 RepID=UPI0033BEB653
MRHIVVISTGGTIASRWNGSGYAAEAAGQELLDEAVLPDGVTTKVVDLFTVNSSQLTSAQQLSLLHTVHRTLRDPDVDGLVVTHGTDTLEESAFLLDLHHHDPRPVVFTGAQRPLEAADSDGPGNLRDALLAAAEVRDAGVLVAFGGLLHSARGTVKRQTLAPDAFGDPSDGHLGTVGFGRVRLRGAPSRSRPLPLPPPAATAPRVDMVAHHVDGDPSLLRAALATGARGVVLVATGAGNATPQWVDAVREATSSGVLVALTTRVPAGPIAALYTGGGAVDLIEAGAVPTGTLRAAQARTAVLAALTQEVTPDQRPALLRELLTPGEV